MKTYVLTVSRNFPKTHKRAGENTQFIEKIIENVDIDLRIPGNSPEFLNWTRHNYEPKIHTIRSNYPLWNKRIKEVQYGKAVLSLRYWSGKPYNSKQVEFARLDKDSGLGIQKIESFDKFLGMVHVEIGPQITSAYYFETIATNDGLSTEDFMEWFKSYDLSKPMAIIHFTNFRY